MKATWRKVSIGQFLFERKGKYKPDDKTVAGLQRIDKIDFSGRFYIADKPSQTNMILIYPGDLVISGINVSKGALGVYFGDQSITATIHYSSYTFDTAQINVEYFKRFLRSTEFTRLLQQQVKGGIKTEIKPNHLLSLEINLPNLKEQARIVAYFEGIESEHSALQQEVIRQQTLLKKLRQQILQEAVEGKLTADWRAQNPDVEPASELLARIQAEKAQLVKAKKISKQNPLPPISEEEKPFALPDGWVWCRLGEIGEIQGGTPSKSEPKFWDGNIPWICPKDMKRKYLSGSIYQISQEAIGQSSAKLIEENSILFVVRGMILAHTFPVGINKKITTINQDMKGLTPFIAGMEEYLYLTLKGNAVKVLKCVRTSTHGTCRLESDIYFNWIVALPPLPEQKAIVAKVEKLLSLCDQLEHEISQNQCHAEQLMQAVLSEAFSQPSEQTTQPAAVPVKRVMKQGELFLKPPAAQTGISPLLLQAEQQGFYTEALSFPCSSL